MNQPVNKPGPAKFAGAVLCGGESRRMGADKALLELGDRALARRVADALISAGAEQVVAIGGDASRLERWGLQVVADGHPREGPLGGVLTALRACSGHDLVAILACDLVEPDPATIARVTDALAADQDAHVAVAVAGGRRHFHHAVWRQTGRGPIQAAFDAGERAPRRVAQSLRVREVEVSRPEVLRDVDDPATFQHEVARYHRNRPEEDLGGDTRDRRRNPR